MRNRFAIIALFVLLVAAVVGPVLASPPSGGGNDPGEVCVTLNGKLMCFPPPLAQ